MIQDIFLKVLGSKHDREVKRLKPTVERINEICEGYHGLSDEELKAKTEEFKKRLAEDETVEDLLLEAFAAVKEACRRLVGKRWEVAGIETDWEMIPLRGKNAALPFDESRLRTRGLTAEICSLSSTAWGFSAMGENSFSDG